MTLAAAGIGTTPTRPQAIAARCATRRKGKWGGVRNIHASIRAADGAHMGRANSRAFGRMVRVGFRVGVRLPSHFQYNRVPAVQPARFRP